MLRCMGLQRVGHDLLMIRRPPRSTHIIIKLLKIKVKGKKLLKAPGKNQHILTRDFSRKTMESGMEYNYTLKVQEDDCVKSEF